MPFLVFFASFLNYLFNLDSLHLKVAVERCPLNIVSLVAVRIFSVLKKLINIFSVLMKLINIFSVLKKLINGNKFDEIPSSVTELALGLGSPLFAEVVAISDVLGAQGSGPSTVSIVVSHGKGFWTQMMTNI